MIMADAIMMGHQLDRHMADAIIEDTKLTSLVEFLSFPCPNKI